ncbi:kinase-like protein [Athelia psychrophila]|uniref:Kinase-like protein n=1 Tax=Athelia psychrophila TaxID=1759441 RepID=A0A165XUN9_9AGAM|nr:kinase-like protein [Fibularhizoctonia sp. CBS 109695]
MLTRPNTAEAVGACTGFVARNLVNLIQACVDYGSLNMETKRRLVRTLTKLSKSSQEVPKAMILDNVSAGERIGGGGFGSVYKGTWRGQEVAVKEVKIVSGANVEELAKAAAREAVTCRQLVHPNVAPFYGVSRDGRPENPAVWLVSALMDCDLHEFLQKNLKDVQQNKGEHALDIAQGLEYIHEEGIIHSDLKSMNILMSANGRAFLADFGIAKPADTETKAQTTERSNGTYFWKAPELFKNGAHATTASDIYAYGMICYEMFSGLWPFHGQVIYGHPPSVRGERPPFPESQNTPAGERGLNLYVWKYIESCWAQEVESRPSAKEVVVFYLGEVDPPEDLRGVDKIVSPVANSSAESIANSFMIW